MAHLTLAQRYTIECMHKKGYKQKDISEAINKDKSVVSRELKRNCDLRNNAYRSSLAQQKYTKRQKEKPRKRYFTAEIKAYIDDKLYKKFSPEQIVGTAKKNSVAMVSCERIYQYIWEDKKRGGELYSHLRTRGKRYRKRGCLKDKRGIIRNRVSIEERPKQVEERKRTGDLEIDTIIGKNHQKAIVTINDRVTGQLLMKKLESKNADQLAKATIELLSPMKDHIKTITADNGKEFAEHQKIAEKLGIDFFFAHPYHSWERGSNENLNGLIRQYIPKKTDFNTITDQYIQFVQDELNNRPRKRFNFLSPNHKFKQLKVAFIT